MDKIHLKCNTRHAPGVSCHWALKRGDIIDIEWEDAPISTAIYLRPDSSMTGWHFIIDDTDIGPSMDIRHVRHDQITGRSGLNAFDANLDLATT